jgi:hypothetical protein
MNRLSIIVFLCGVLGLRAIAQTPTVVDVCPYSPRHQKALACLIPDLTITGQSQNLSHFNTTRCAGTGSASSGCACIRICTGL